MSRLILSQFNRIIVYILSLFTFRVYELPNYGLLAKFAVQVHASSYEISLKSNQKVKIPAPHNIHATIVPVAISCHDSIMIVHRTHSWVRLLMDFSPAVYRTPSMSTKPRRQRLLPGPCQLYSFMSHAQSVWRLQQQALAVRFPSTIESNGNILYPLEGFSAAWAKN